MKLAILGINNMGNALVDKLLREGHEVVIWNLTKDIYEQLKVSKSEYLLNQKLTLALSIEGLREKLMEPRVFWLMQSAGKSTEDIIAEVANIAEPGDIIVDGGNANYKDTQRRYEELTQKNLKFLGIGIAGDIRGLDEGFCLMVGGNKDGFEYIRPALDSLVLPGGGYNYFGEGGAGHFVKSVHNGIEYGMMQSLAEGIGVLQKSKYEINVLDAASVWQRGGILRSYLLDLFVNILLEDQELMKNEGLIDTSGDGKWTVEAGKEEHVPVDIIAKALEFREHSQYDKGVQNTLAAKIVAEMRKKFGAHEEIKRENKV